MEAELLNIGCQVAAIFGLTLVVSLLLWGSQRASDPAEPQTLWPKSLILASLAVFGLGACTVERTEEVRETALIAHEAARKAREAQLAAELAASEASQSAGVAIREAARSAALEGKARATLQDAEARLAERQAADSASAAAAAAARQAEDRAALLATGARDVARRAALAASRRAEAEAAVREAERALAGTMDRQERLLKAGTTDLKTASEAVERARREAEARRAELKWLEVEARKAEQFAREVAKFVRDPSKVWGDVGRAFELDNPDRQVKPGSPQPFEVVRLFYGTDRRNEGLPDHPDFSGERGGEVSLGNVFVSIPTTHRIGEVERPWRRILLGVIPLSEDEDPKRHFTIQRIESLDQQTFVEELQKSVEESEGYEDQALVFIHGYNVSFDAAAYRTAQLAYDLQFDGAPIFYSWPSRGSIEDYEYDQNSVRQARPFLKEFLEMVRAESGAEVIHLIAHSMGNDPLMEVLARVNAGRDEQAPLFNQIILAAPDIDVDVFYQLAKQIDGVAQGVTLYASAQDRALRAAKAYARGVPRAGDVPARGPVIVPGIDTIDITVVGSDLLSLNHSEYADNRMLLNDIGLLLKAGLRPPDARNPTLRRLELGDAGHYWAFPQ